MSPGPLLVGDAWLAVLSPTAYPVAFAQVHALGVERRRERAALAQVLFAVCPNVAPAELMASVAVVGMPQIPIAQLVAEAEAVAWAAVRDREGLDVPILPASVEARPLRHLFAVWPSAAEWSLWARKAEAARRRS
jgi:hypothetical protein